MEETVTTSEASIKGGIKKILIVTATNPTLPPQVPQTSEVVSSFFQRKGFTGETVTAHTSDEALSILGESNKFDLIVIDGVLLYEPHKIKAGKNGQTETSIAGARATTKDTTFPIIDFMTSHKDRFANTNFISIAAIHTPQDVNVSIRNGNDETVRKDVPLHKEIVKRLKSISSNVSFVPKSESHWYDLGLDKALADLDIEIQKDPTSKQNDSQTIL